jgi:hypothetical protein
VPQLNSASAGIFTLSLQLPRKQPEPIAALLAKFSETECTPVVKRDVHRKVGLYAKATARLDFEAAE